MYAKRLTADNFTVVPQTNGSKNILKSNIPNLSICMFYGTDCPACMKAKPIFEGLKIPHQLCLVNIKHNPQLASLSQNTTTPIEFVPYIVIYEQGLPTKVYDNSVEPSKENLHTFVSQHINSIRSKTPQKPLNTGPKPFSKKVCYLPYSKAYGQSRS